ncbi:MAG: Ferredoxin--NADP reductase [Chlamydiae bacterium]|nr:Ferredoxin--NADP reductase [Chlamydiota bacterium]
MYDLIVIGGGAAGIFAALNAKQKGLRIAVFEKTATLLAKVRISGGGRCNVTHACFDPLALSKNYPRGSKELVGPFHHFQPQDTIDWFAARGTKLKAEVDGRMFPVTNRSETIINTLLSEAKKLGIEILLQQKIATIEKKNHFTLTMRDGRLVETKNLLLATGSSHQGHAFAAALGHTIAKPVPSLFTFNVPSSPLKSLSGISVEKVRITIDKGKFSEEGPLLITHFGFSGPAILKLSAWAARYLHEKEYSFEICINWLPGIDTRTTLISLKEKHPSKTLLSENPFHLPKNLWKSLLSEQGPLRDIPIKNLNLLSEKLHANSYLVEGKTTHKDEFVTCGGVDLREVNFKTMESKKCPGLFFAGEILDIDGVTGGFNFQNGWTTGYLAGSYIMKKPG